MTAPAPVVFLLDVDNTLLDNDQVIDDLRQHLTQAFGRERQACYWKILEERQLDDVERHYPAHHYVLVDDKLRILAAVKKAWGPRLTTVFPRQGHYAHDPRILATYPPADITIECIGDLLRYDLPALTAGTQQVRSPATTKMQDRP